MFSISDSQINLLVAYFIWPFTRILGVLLADPIFASRFVPRRFKAGFALALTILVAPLLPPLPTVPLVSAEGVVILMQQLLIGITIGFVMRIVISAVEFAGFVMATQMGLGFAMFFDPGQSAQVPTISRVFTILTTLLFLAFDGHHILITALVDSFRTLPIGVSMPVVSLRLFAEWGANLFKWGLWLSLPVVGSLLVANLAIGVMTRAAPQFNVFSFGFPLTLGIGFVAIYLVLPMMEPAIVKIYQEAFGFIGQLMIAP